MSGIIYGLIIGVALGVALDNLALWIVVGMAIGAVTDVIDGKSKKAENVKDLPYEKMIDPQRDDLSMEGSDALNYDIGAGEDSSGDM